MIRINLLPKEMQKPPQIIPSGVPSILGICLVVVILSSLYGARLAQIHDAEQELLRLQEEIEYFSPYLPKNVDLQAALRQAKEEYAEVSVLDEDNLPFWALLAKTSTLIDEAAWIERFTVAPDGKVSIKGNALSYASVSGTMNSLRKDSTFGSPQLNTAYTFQVPQSGGLYAVGFEITTSAVRRVD